MLHLYRSESESESDIAWNGYIGFQVVCLHWEAIISGKDQRNFRFSLSLLYKCSITFVPTG